ncbi:MBOAT family O-acyltransferase [Nonlabens ulvanivorans]|uniref:MBOAT family O-acyltransferase n=4 Tax=Nonlabens ulvanivorans TaxID=906888 RepID=UPI0032656CED
MSFISISYLLFFPVIALLYYVLPHKLRWILLLVGSYFFYMSWNVKYALLMLLSTVITYLSGILISKVNQSELTEKLKIKRKKLWLTLSLVSNLGILIFFKYFNFLNSAVADFFSLIHVEWGFENIDVLLPVGISFYTFQALSYSLDVYFDRIKATHHFGKYALFVSFFPQLVAGPIERSSHLLPQLDKVISFDYSRIRSGLGLVVWGIFKKVVIANRLAVVVNQVYSDPGSYSGFETIIATIFFSFQIYTDFSAYTDIARGSARMLGYDLMKNFNQPYFATSIPDFWRRWHISLTTWFRDYLYIPLGGNRVSKWRWYVNIMIVFLVSGFWHGAAWSFIIWGFLHGIFQMIDLWTQKSRSKMNSFMKIKENSFDVLFFKRVWTFVLVSFAWIFFRAETFEKAMLVISNSMNLSFYQLLDGSMYELGLDSKDFTLAILLIIGLLAFWSIDKRYPIRTWLYRKHIATRYIVYLSTIFFILIFGYYGSEYNVDEFIYFQF